MRGIRFPILLLIASNQKFFTFACLRGTHISQDPSEEQKISLINKFLKKHHPDGLKLGDEKDSAEVVTHSSESTPPYWTIYFGNLAPSFLKHLAPSFQEDLNLSPRYSERSSAGLNEAPEIDYDSASSVEDVYAQYGLTYAYDTKLKNVPSFSTYDYQSYYSDDAENNLIYSPDDDYMQVLPRNMETKPPYGSSKFEIGNLLAAITRIKFPVILSFASKDSEAAYNDENLEYGP